MQYALDLGAQHPLVVGNNILCPAFLSILMFNFGDSFSDYDGWYSIVNPPQNLMDHRIKVNLYQVILVSGYLSTTVYRH